MSDPNAEWRLLHHQKGNGQSYLSLGFDTLNSNGQVALGPLATYDLGQSSERRLEVPVGTYYLTLRIAYEPPTKVEDSEGGTQYHYKNKAWHVEAGPETMQSDREWTEVTIVCNGQDSKSAMGWTNQYEIQATHGDVVMMGEISFRGPGDYKLMVVGDFHLLFLESFQKRPHLEYYIHVV